MFSLVALILLQLSYFPLPAYSVCWFPDGKTPAAQDTPCSSGNSTCCGPGFACLSNNLCMLTAYVSGAGSGQSTYVRGSCTDPTWTDPNCPNFCVDVAHGDNPHGGMGLSRCDGTTKDMYFCNDNNTANVDCGGARNVVVFQGFPTTVTIIGVKSTAASSSTSSLSASGSSTTPSATMTTAPPSAAVTSASITPTPASTPNYSTAVGAGVGVPLGVIAIAVCAYLALRYSRKKANSAQDLYTHPAMLIGPTKPPDTSQIVEIGRENYPPQELPAHRSPRMA